MEKQRTVKDLSDLELCGELFKAQAMLKALEFEYNERIAKEREDLKNEKADSAKPADSE